MVSKVLASSYAKTAATMRDSNCQAETRAIQYRNAIGNWRTRGYANLRIANSRTGHLADWSTHALVNSRTGQLAVSQMPPKEQRLSTESCRWHLRVVQSTSWRIRELSSNHTPREQLISEVGGGPPLCLVWTSSPSHRLTLLF